MLAYPTSDDQFVLDTDASNTGTGAVLSQVQNGEEKVIAYFSKTLDKAERNHCTNRKELLAIITAVRHFYHYLCGSPFLIRTDHSALRWLLNFKNPEGQLARWLKMLGTYDLVIEYRPGQKHLNADTLSRRPCTDCNVRESAKNRMSAADESPFREQQESEDWPDTSSYTGSAARGVQTRSKAAQPTATTNTWLQSATPV